MNLTDTAKLLAVASGFDNRNPDKVAVTAWQAVLSEYTLEECLEAVMGHYRDSTTRHSYLTIAHILDRVEKITRSREQVAADVRSAKARGLLDAKWSAGAELPPDVAQKLADARRGENALVEGVLASLDEGEPL